MVCVWIGCVVLCCVVLCCVLRVTNEYLLATLWFLCPAPRTMLLRWQSSCPPNGVTEGGVIRRGRVS